MQPLTPPLLRRRGWTLVELMVTMVIFLLLIAGFYTWAIGIMTASKLAVGMADVSKDMRKITTSLTDEARNCSFYTVYTSFSDRTPVGDGFSGDFIVLSYTDDTGAVVRSIGYFRDAPTASEGPVRRYDSAAPGGPAAGTLPATTTAANWPEIIQLARGLSTGRLFYNFRMKSVMISGEIIRGGSANRVVYEGGSPKPMRATNTYNFTVSPRN